MIILTFPAAIKFGSHRNMSLPCFWMNTNVTSNNGRFQIVIDRGIPIIISWKYLKDNEMKSHITKSIALTICLSVNQISNFAEHIYVALSKLIYRFVLITAVVLTINYLFCPVLIVIFKKHSIVAIRKAEAFHPLIGILSSLNDNPSYFCPITKIYLKILEDVIRFRCPRSMSP